MIRPSWVCTRGPGAWIAEGARASGLLFGVGTTNSVQLRAEEKGIKVLGDAIETTHLKTMPGDISFDQNGELVTKVISVFQVVRNPEYPDDDVVHQ